MSSLEVRHPAAAAVAGEAHASATRAAARRTEARFSHSSPGVIIQQVWAAAMLRQMPILKAACRAPRPVRCRRVGKCPKCVAATLYRGSRARVPVVEVQKAQRRQREARG